MLVCLLPVYAEFKNHTLVFIRHGESEWNDFQKSEARKGIMGRLKILYNAVWSDRYVDAKLSERGRYECSRVADLLRGIF